MKKVLNDLDEKAKGARRDTESKESYQVVMGDNAVKAKVKRLIADARQQVRLVLSNRNF